MHDEIASMQDIVYRILLIIRPPGISSSQGWWICTISTHSYKIYSHGLNAIQILYSQTVLPLCYNTSQTVLPLCYNTSQMVLPLCYNTSQTVLPLCYNTSQMVLSLCYNTSQTVLPLCYQELNKSMYDSTNVTTSKIQEQHKTIWFTATDE